MSLDVTITVEGLQGVADAIIKLAGAILAQRVDPAQPVVPVSSTAPAQDAPLAQPSETEVAQVDSEPSMNQITREMIREAFVAAARHPKVQRAELKKLLADCGAESVSTLPENRFAEVYSVLSHLAKDVQ